MRSDSEAGQQEIDDVRDPRLDPSQPSYDPARDPAYDPEAPRTEAEVVEASERDPAPGPRSSNVDDTPTRDAETETGVERGETAEAERAEQADTAEAERAGYAVGAAEPRDVDAHPAATGPAQPHPVPTDLEPGPAEPVPAGAEQPPAQVGVAEAERAEAEQAEAERAEAEQAEAAKITTERMPGELPAEPLTTLWSDESAQDFRDRWRDVQLRFVDDPHGAAEEAQALLAEVVDRLTGTVNQRRHDLDSWRSAEVGDTEELRVVVRRYRDLLDRLLGI